MSSPAPAVSVIIVLYNSGATIGRCLEALKAQIYRDFELILVDNASPQREADGLNLPENGRLIRASENLGFAGGNNLAARQARGRWLCLLNPDAVAEPDWLGELVTAAERHGAAAAGSLQLKDDAPGVLDGAGDVCHVSGLAWRGGFGKPVETAPAEPCEIFGPCAAAALYERAAFLALGGFHERFFCYYEDVDLAFRLRLAGHRAILVPSARVRHVGSATTGGRHSDFAVYHGLRNLIWGFAKNMPARLLPLAIPLHVIMVALLLGKNLLRGTGGPAWRGVRHGVGGLGAAMADRAAVQRGTAPGANLMVSLNPVAPLTRPIRTRPLRPGGPASP